MPGQTGYDAKMMTLNGKIGAAILCLGGIWAAGARGEDLTTLAGQTYSNVVVQEFDRKGIYVRYDGGSTQVFYREIMPELRGYYKSRAAYPLSMETLTGEKEEPAGTNDLETVTGQIYRNVVLKQVNENSLLIAHDGGMATVHFSAIPPDRLEKYRTGTPVVPDPPPGANDLVTTSGQIFRNVEVVRSEPDGLTIRHAGGVSKLWFISLSEELQQKYGFDPVAARNYQRGIAASNRVAQEGAAVEQSTVPATIAVRNIETEALTNNEFWIRFVVQNLADQDQSINVVPCEQSLTPIMTGKTISIPAGSAGTQQQIVVPEIQPRYLKVTCGAYFTNCFLKW